MSLWSPNLDCTEEIGTGRLELGPVFLIRQVLTALHLGGAAVVEVGCQLVVCKVPNLMN